MLTEEELQRRRCRNSLWRLLEMVPALAAARMPMTLDDSSVALIVASALLRWERTIHMTALRWLNIDISALTRDVDMILDRRRAEAAKLSDTSGLVDEKLDAPLRRLLDQAEEESKSLDQGFLATEHLLLAILRHADETLAAVFSAHGLNYEMLRAKVVDVLAKIFVDTPIVNHVRRNTPDWDTGAVGVPRRFGMNLMFLMVTLYALLFAAMQLLGADPQVFAVVAIMVTAVALGQMAMFGGTHPRAASLRVGAWLFPLEMLGVALWNDWISWEDATAVSFNTSMLLVGTPICVGIGAIFGYLSGCMAAGVFFLIEKYGTKQEETDASQMSSLAIEEPDNT
jgi:hypothetical protein